MRFGDVAASAIRFATEGFVMYPLMAGLIESYKDSYARWASSAAVYLPNGAPPAVGDLFVQRDLGATLQYMVACEAARGGARTDGLQAARDAFYKGDIARTIAGYHEANGGFLSMEDMAAFACGIEAPVRGSFHGAEVFTCGPWCQGPTLIQMLHILENADLRAIELNSAEYLRSLAAAVNLTFADREAFYGDPQFVDVPLEKLLSKAYARRLWNKIVSTVRSGELSVGDVAGAQIGPALDTSYVVVIDRWGNVFSATPSDTSYDTPIIPGTGLAVSSRGSQSWANPAHPSGVAPGKRPRLTPNPALVKLQNGDWLGFGTPGGDVQTQAMLQVFLNIVVHGLDLQAAVEAPRFASYSFPDSFEPHETLPGRIALEARIDRTVEAPLVEAGHDVEWQPGWNWRAGAVCVARLEHQSKRVSAGADPRRPAYALGW